MRFQFPFFESNFCLTTGICALLSDICPNHSALLLQLLRSSVGSLAIRIKSWQYIVYNQITVLIFNLQPTNN